MPGTNCSVKGCKNYFGVHKDISFHVFPRDLDLKERWAEFCKRGENWIPKRQSKICSAHFRKDDFELSFRKELLNVPTKAKLRKTAVPTKHTGDRIEGGVLEEITLEYTDSDDDYSEVKFETVDMDHIGSDSGSENQEQEMEENLHAQFETMHREIANLKRKTEEQEVTISKMKILNDSLAKDLHNERHRNLYLKNKVNLLESEKMEKVPQQVVLRNNKDVCEKPIVIIVSNEEIVGR